MILLLPILALCIPNALGQAQQSAARVRLTSNGLNFAGQQAVQILTKELPKIPIPDIQEGDITVSNIHIIQFSPPSAHVDFQSPAVFTWTLNGASIGLTTHVHACKKILIPKICGSLDAQMEASNVNIRVLTTLGRKAQEPTHPYILTSSAQISIGKLDLKTGGGVLGWVLDLFSGIIAGVVKPKIEKAVADQVGQIIMTQIDQLIAKLPVDKLFDGKIDFQYGIVDDPLVTGNHLDLDITGKVSSPLKPSMVSPYPFTPLAQDIQQDSRMIYALVSDKVLNDVLYFAHQLDLTQYLVTQDTPQVGPYLKLHCEKGICLGNYVLNVDKLYPNVPSAVNLVKTKSPPTVRVNADGTVSLFANVTSDLFAPTPTRNSSILLANLYLSATLDADFNSSRLVASVNMSDIGLEIVESEQMDPRIIEALKYYLNPMIKPLMQEQINKILNAGFEIPSIHGASLGSPVLRLLERTVQLETDVVFVPPVS